MRVRAQTVRFLHQTVAKEGFRCAVLHGQRSQHERDEAMRDFRSGKAQVRGAARTHLLDLPPSPSPP